MHPSAPVPQLLASLRTAVLQCCSGAAGGTLPRTWLSLCKPEERGHVVLQQTGERLLVTAELQLLNTAVTVAVCAEAQTSVCW